MHLFRSFLLTVLTGASFFTQASAATTLSGTLPGDLSVDNRGSANYAIPLDIPPGVNGLQPSLTLGYNSNSGNGDVGIGWGLSTGFPQAITRGRTILARDSIVKGVTFTATDKFYLDGKLLVRTGGTYGSAGSTYRTEVDSFVSITASGSGTTINTFTVVTKNGLTLTFGKLGSVSDAFQTLQGTTSTSVSPQAYRYALKQVKDAYGNTITYTYTNQGESEYLLTQITYGTSNSLIYVYLAYEGKTDTRKNYLGGYGYRSSKRLKTITSKVGSSTVIAYNLTYDLGSKTKQSRLKSIYASYPNSTQTPATIFEYTPANTISLKTGGTDVWPGKGSYGTQISPSSYTITGDFDQNGTDEIQRVDGLTFPTYATGLHSLVKQGDFDGDGIPDKVLVTVNVPSAQANGVTTAGYVQTTVTLSSSGNTITLKYPGKTDLTTYFYDKALNGAPSNYTNNLAYEGAGISKRIVIGDFTGDGRDDVMIHSMQGNLYLFKSQGTSFSPPTLAASNVGGEGTVTDRSRGTWTLNRIPYFEVRTNGKITPSVADLNGDGVADYVFIHEDDDQGGIGSIDVLGGTVYTYMLAQNIRALLSKGDGTFSGYASLGEIGYTCSNSETFDFDKLNQGYQIGDFNGDGLSDVLVNSPLMGGNNWARWWLYISKGQDSNGKYIYEQIPGCIPNTVTISGKTVSTHFKPCADNGFLGIRNLSSIATDSRLACLVGSLESTNGFLNAFVADMNDDGLSDYVWCANYENAAQTTTTSLGWYVMYSTGEFTAASVNVPTTWGTGFSDPVSISSFGTPKGIYGTNTGSYGLHQYSVSKGADFNGDGYGDYISDYSISVYSVSGSRVYPYNSRTVYYSSADVTRPDLLKAITDGLGRRTEVEYKAAKDSDVYTKGSAVTYPIREAFGSNPVVSDVYKDFGGTFWTDTDGDGVHDTGEPYKDAYHTSYQYSGNRTDLSGRGNLGFHSFVTLDHQTKLFKYQFLSQSFPTTGLVKREQTYRATPTYDTSGNVTACTLQPISSQDNDVVFDEVRNGPSGALWGTVYPFMSHSSELRWEDGVATCITVTEANPESLFSQYNSLYTANKAKAHSNIESYVWFDEQNLSATPVTALPSAFSESSIPGAQDSVPVGFTSWGTSTSGTLYNFGLPKKISYGNITRTKLIYSDSYTTDTVTDYVTPASSSGNRTDLPLWTQTRTTAPGGNVNSPITEYTYNAYGKVATKTTNSGYSTASSTPSAKWAVTSANSNLSPKETYTYSSKGLLQQKVLTDNTSSTYYTLRADNYMTSQVTAWDSTGRFPATVVDAYSHPTTNTYDAFGRVTRISDVNGSGAATTYDGLGRAISVTDNLLGLTTTTTIHTTSGSGVTGPQTVAVPSNTSGGLHLTSKYYTRVVADGQPPVTTHYDRTGRPIRVIKEGFSGQVTYTDTIYNLDGEIIAVSNPYLSSTAANNIPWTRNTYDALGRIKTVTAPNGTVTTTTYNGRVSQVAVKATDRSDTQKTTSLINVKGETVKVWNADNVPSSINQTGSTTTPASIEYVLDGLGRMKQTKQWQGGSTYSTITSAYDALGNQTQLADPDKGTWNYIYDALGELRYQRDAVGNTTVNLYDRLGRQLRRTVTEASSGPVESTVWYYYETQSAVPNSGHFLYAPKTQWIGAVQREYVSTSWASNTSDRLRNYSMQTAYYYNNKGQMYLDLHNQDGKWFYRHQTFDAYSRPLSTNYYWRPKGLEGANYTKPYMWQSYGYTNTYDGEGYITKVSDSMGKTWWQSNGTAAYDYLDRPSNFIKGGTANTRTYKGYDPNTGLLTAVRTGTNGSSSYSVQNLTYSYDGLGNLKSRADALRGKTETFNYDVLNRLTSSAVGSTSRSYSYATNGNITAKKDINGTSSGTYSYHGTKKHAVTSAFGYTMGYDANGNVSSRTGNSETWYYNWNGFDKPRWMGRTKGSGTAGNAYLYGADHMRKIGLDFDSISSSKPYHYSDKTLYVANGEMELDYYNSTVSGSGENWNLKTVRVYIPAPDGRAGCAELNPNATSASAHKFRVYHYDHLGSVQCITNWGTATLATNTDSTKKSLYSYEAWGERRDPADWIGAASSQSTYTSGGDTDATPRGFTGHEMLDDLGLIHMNGRIYDPQIGRFLSADPIIQTPGNLQSYNRYSYCMNNPLTYVDPTGYQMAGYQQVDGETDDEYRRRIAQLEEQNRKKLEQDWNGSSATDRIQASGVTSAASDQADSFKPAKERTDQAGVDNSSKDKLPQNQSSLSYKEQYPDFVISRGGDIDAVYQTLEKLPKSVIDSLVDGGIKIYAVKNSVVEFDSNLKGVYPRGWEGTGITWDYVPGYFSPGRKAVVIATSGKYKTGSFNFRLHEIGHAYDKSQKHLSRKARFKNEYNSDKQKMGPYYQQPGNTGSSEAFAESFSRFYGKDKSFQNELPSLYKYWIETNNNLK